MQSLYLYCTYTKHKHKTW